MNRALDVITAILNLQNPSLFNRRIAGKHRLKSLFLKEKYCLQKYELISEEEVRHYSL